MAEYAVQDDYSIIKKRRGMYIGRADNGDERMYLYDVTTDTLKYEKVRLNFTLLKLYDEILVNAIDNMSRTSKSKSLTRIDVTIADNEISVFNDGPSIAIQKYTPKPRGDESDVAYQRRMAIESTLTDKYVPEVLFTVPKSSSNYNDDENRTTGGLNGIGAKLTCIFSSRFTIDIVNDGKHYVQNVYDGCERIEAPVITKTKEEPHVRITFVPSWIDVDPTGEVTAIDDTMKQVLSKRLFDYSHLPIALTLNGIKLPKLDYIEFTRKHLVACGQPSDHIYHCPCPHPFKDWRVALAYSPKAVNVSYVNNVVTYSGGAHVKGLQKQVEEYIKSKLKKKQSAVSIRNRMSIVLYSIIPKAAFIGQSKDAISNKRIAVPTFPQDFLERFASESGILDYFKNGATKTANVKATRRRITKIAKLRDAEVAGVPFSKRKRSPCTLFICEGDSAQTLCDRGIKLLGEKCYGSYALRGKPLNTLKSSNEQYAKNVELTELKEAIGLVDGKEYTSTDDLRYQRLVCCKDADYDGSAIMGLVINFLYQRFRSLMLLPGFFFEFITPVITVYRKPYVPATALFEKAYYNLNEFKRDCEGDAFKGKYCKYIKGLAGNTNKDVECYFKAFDRHLIHVDCQPEKTSDHINLAYANGFADARKTWIASVNDESYLPRDSSSITFNDFCEIDLALAGFDTCERSIPAVIDGMKPSQRKVIYTYFGMSKKQASTSTKVFQITGRVADYASYHHGDQSLNGAITKMAQDFIGSNNIPLLAKDGQFGSRNKLGDDCGAPRYIAAYLAPITRYIYPECDDGLLARRSEDNELVEPHYYVPIIPMLLANGTNGIGTGWRTEIPMFNPKDLISETRKAIDSVFSGKSISQLRILPWCPRWKGTVTEYSDQWIYEGKVVKDGDVYHIVDIPVYMSIDSLRAAMNKAIDDGILSDYSNVYSKGKHAEDDADAFDFKLTFTDAAKVTSEEDVINLLDLRTRISKNTLVAFNQSGHPCLFKSITAIFAEWFKERLNLYYRRKTAILETMMEELNCLKSKLRFAQRMKGYHLDELSDDDIETLLDKEGYFKKSDSYSYLLDMPVRSCTPSRIAEMESLVTTKERIMREYNAQTVQSIWKAELDSLEAQLDKA